MRNPPVPPTYQQYQQPAVPAYVAQAPYQAAYPAPTYTPQQPAPVVQQGYVEPQPPMYPGQYTSAAQSNGYDIPQEFAYQAPQPAPYIGQHAPAYSRYEARTAPAVSPEEVQRLNSELAELKADVARRNQAEQAARLAGMRPSERNEAELATLREAIQTTAARANEWRIEAEKARIVQQYDGDIDASALDCSSVAAMQASIPRALESWRRIEERIQTKHAQRLGINLRQALDILPPSPSQYMAQAMPMPNRAGAVPMYPQAPSQPMQHPQLSAAQQPQYGQGRVVQPVTYQAQQFVQQNQPTMYPGQYMSEQLGYEAPRMVFQDQQSAGTQGMSAENAAAVDAIRRARTQASSRAGNNRGKSNQTDYMSLPDPSHFATRTTHPQIIQ